MSAKHEPAINPEHRGCLNCPAPTRLLSMDRAIGVGFGFACVSKDDETIFEESYGMEYDDLMTVEQAEALAAADPNHDWRITLHGPLHGETYQRQGERQWVCIESNQGFA